MDTRSRATTTDRSGSTRYRLTHVTTLLYGATPVGSGPAAQPVDIFIDAGRITEVRRHVRDADNSAAGPRRADRFVDARDKLVLPGLVNAHFHSHDRFDRGRYDTLPLEVWRTCYNPPNAGRQWTTAETYLRTLLSGAELLRFGTTTVVDDVHLGSSLSEANANQVFRAYHDLGIRAEVSIAFSDLPFQADLPYASRHIPAHLQGQPRRHDEIEWLLDLWTRLAASQTELVRFALSPSAPLRCSRTFLDRVAELSARYDLPVLIHLLESRSQALAAREHDIDSLALYLLDRGLLNSRTLLFHAVWVNERDIALIAEHDARVVHCPGSNLKLGSGIAPIRRLRDAGIPLGLGSDNLSANDTCSMLEQAKLAALLSRTAGSHPSAWVTAGEALAMATAPRGWRPTAAGPGLTAGAPADLVLLDRNATCFQPENDLVNHMVFAASAAEVDTVLVAGEVVVEGGTVTTVDESDLLAELRDRAPEVQRKIAEGESLGAQLRPYLQLAYDEALTAAASIDAE